MKRKLWFLVALVLIIAEASYAQELSTSQRKQLFDFDWKFFPGEVSGAARGNFNDGPWRKLNLPHDWSIEGQISPDNPSGNDGGYFPTGTAWYRKRFVIPTQLRGKKLSFYFEGVYRNAEVFVNGKSLGGRPYGYSAFRIDLPSSLLKFGGENVIAVHVDNALQKNSRWYSGSGIYRHVWLVATNPVHIPTWGVTITSPEANEKDATIQVQTTIENETLTEQTLVLATQILEEALPPVASRTTKVVIAPGQRKEVTQLIQVVKPRLWSPAFPALYTARVSVQREGRVVDKTDTRFGIRSLAFSVENGFQLNGNKVILNGGCVHHDNGFLGAAAYDRAEVKKVELLKAAGFNAVRTSHNPPSEAFLNACDSLGLLVMDEAFDGWRTKKTAHDYAKDFDDWWEKDLEAMVLRDRNHPSIFMWSIGNEIIERKEPQAIQTANMLASYVRSLDRTRPVTSAMTTWDKEWEIFDPLFAAHDVGGYNYQLHRAPSDHERVPARMMIQTESYPRDAFENWKLVNKHRYIFGDFVWTALDYLGESSIGRYYYPGEPDGQHWEKDFYPWHGAYCGDIDLTGWRKPISHYRDMLYNPQAKKIYLAVKEPNPENGPIKETMWAVWPTWESWNWPGYEGKPIQVEVYSKYPSVRLYLNGKSIAEQATTEAEGFKATFNVPYSPGTLKAVGVENDQEKEQVQLQTAGKEWGLKLTADRSRLAANGQDLAYVVVEVTDEQGRLQPNAENLLTFELSGKATLLALGNANLKDPAPYVGKSTKAWKGRAVAILRSGLAAGAIELKVSSPGLKPRVIRLISEKR